MEGQFEALRGPAYSNLDDWLSWRRLFQFFGKVGEQRDNTNLEELINYLRKEADSNASEPQQHALSIYVLGMLIEERDKGLEEAEKLVRKAIELQPNTARFHAGLAYLLELQEKMEEAEQEFRKGVELAPKSPVNLSNLARLLFERGDLAGEAERLFRKSIEVSNGKYDPAFLYLSDLLLSKGRYEEAEQCIRSVLLLIPADSSVHCNMASLLARPEVGRYSEAERYYKTAIELQDTSANHFKYALLLRAMSRLDECAQEYEKSMLLDKEDGSNRSKAAFNLANLLKERGDSKRAEELYNKAIALDPKRYKFHFNLGNMLRGQHRFEEAEKLYRATLQCLPSYSKCHVNLGNLLRETNRLSEALEHYRLALHYEKDPSSITVTFQLVRTLMLIETVASLQEAVTILTALIDRHANKNLPLDQRVTQLYEAVLNQQKDVEDKHKKNLRKSMETVTLRWVRVARVLFCSKGLNFRFHVVRDLILRELGGHFWNHDQRSRLFEYAKDRLTLKTAQTTPEINSNVKKSPKAKKTKLFVDLASRKTTFLKTVLDRPSTTNNEIAAIEMDSGSDSDDGDEKPKQSKKRGAHRAHRSPPPTSTKKQRKK